MSHLHYQLVYAVEFAFMAVVYVLAFQRGDGVVRRVAAVLLAGQIVSEIGWFAFHTGRAFICALDAICLALVVVLAIRTPRPWLLSVCAFQLAAVCTFLAALLDARIQHLALATAGNTWSLLVLAALLWGAIEAWRKAPVSLAPAA
jgi:hypothetical protein